MKRLSFLFLFNSIVSIVLGQLRIDTSFSPDFIVRNRLLQEGSGLLISNIRFSGADYSMASFWDENEEALLREGVIFSTGNVFDAMGPNKKMSTGVRSSGIRDNDLQAIATGVVTDAVVLEFDLLALKDSLEFTYVFASEEYPEYVDKGVNDVFAFFVKEIDGRAIRPLNIARIPNQQTIVSIDNVNHRRNEEFFLRSDFLEAHSMAFWEMNKEMMMRARTYEFDGFTVPLKATIKLKEGKKYHLKIALADVGDRYFDSAVLIKARSLRSSGKTIEKADSIVEAIISEKMKETELSFSSKLKNAFSLVINFNTNEAVILENSFTKLNQLISLLEEFNDLKLTIVGHTDSDGSEEANLKLSEERALAVKNYLIERGNVVSERLLSEGKGENEPISDNQSPESKAQNRRVEFQFYY